MQRKYPRTAEDREAIAAARRKLYASQKPEDVMVVPDPVDDDASKKDVDSPEDKTKSTEHPKSEEPTKEILPTEANKLAAAQAAVPAKESDASEVEIPANYETLGWKTLRALVGKISKTPVVNREQAVHIIAEELQRRAKAAK